MNVKLIYCITALLLSFILRLRAKYLSCYFLCPPAPSGNAQTGITVSLSNANV